MIAIAITLHEGRGWSADTVSDSADKKARRDFVAQESYWFSSHEDCRAAITATLREHEFILDGVFALNEKTLKVAPLAAG